MRSEVITQWHRWFAWYPVTVEGRRVWLETVRRKARYGNPQMYGYDWRYRFGDDDEA